MPAEDLQLGQSVEKGGRGKGKDLSSNGKLRQCVHDMSDTE